MHFLPVMRRHFPPFGRDRDTTIRYTDTSANPHIPTFVLNKRNMKKVKLGSQGLEIPVIGLGCMGMTGFMDGNMYGPADEKEAIATIHRSFELGGNFLDTADMYGPF